MEPLKVAARDDPVDDDRRHAIQLVLHKKYKSSCRVRSDASRKRKKPVKISPPAIIFRFGFWRVVPTVSYFIPLFSSPAVRYAKFGSNRRFKPGD